MIQRLNTLADKDGASAQCHEVLYHLYPSDISAIGTTIAIAIAIGLSEELGTLISSPGYLARVDVRKLERIHNPSRASSLQALMDCPDPELARQYSQPFPNFHRGHLPHLKVAVLFLLWIDQGLLNVDAVRELRRPPSSA